MPALATVRSNLANLFALGKRDASIPEPPLLTRVITPGFWPASPNENLPGERQAQRRTKAHKARPAWLPPGFANRVAIQLKTTLRPITRRSLPDIDALRRFELYTMDHRAEGLTWHRLRLGFFADRDSAERVLGELKHYFKDARVVGVDRRERLSSARSEVR